MRQTQPFSPTSPPPAPNPFRRQSQSPTVGLGLALQHPPEYKIELENANRKKI